MGKLDKVRRIARRYRTARLAYAAYRRTVAAFQYLYFRCGRSDRLLELKNRHYGQRCFIIGNGPSINKQDLTLLQDEFTFGVNFFPLHDKFEQLKINYYCASDNALWQRRNDAHDIIYEKLLKQPDIIVFLEQTGRAFGTMFPQERVFYMFLDYYHKVREGYVSLDISKRVYHGNTVIIDFCIPIAYYMGFKEIYLLGCDCDYHLDEAPDFSQAYFFSLDKAVQQEAYPDAARIVSEAQEWVFAAYRVMKNALDKENVRIYNATAGGKLEVFDRVKFEEMFDKQTK